MGHARGTSSGGVASTTVTTGKGVREHRGCKARYGAQQGKRFDGTRVVRPGYRGERKG